MANTPVDSIPARRVLTDPAGLTRYQHDEAEWAPYGTPIAVVRPQSTEEVRDVVRHCLAHRIPVVPRGDEAARARAQLAFEDILDDAIALGGTVTGEHGVVSCCRFAELE
ncbi:FAD-binding protein [Streptomyces sp. NPDC005506]|uniref:FAD-binding oxidoreductase n=1 Tax=unclassified Streptomyces TaxID=2593676 RepID=UPI0036830B07